MNCLYHEISIYVFLQTHCYWQFDKIYIFLSKKEILSSAVCSQRPIVFQTVTSVQVLF